MRLLKAWTHRAERGKRDACPEWPHTQGHDWPDLVAISLSRPLSLKAGRVTGRRGLHAPWAWAGGALVLQGLAAVCRHGGLGGGVRGLGVNQADNSGGSDSRSEEFGCFHLDTP